MDKINKLINERNLIPLERTPPEEPKKAKPLEKIPDAQIVLDRMKESAKNGNLTREVSHSILLKKLTDAPRHQR